MVAYERAEMLNGLLDAWRSSKGVRLPEADRRFGSVAWAFKEYMNTDAFRRDVSERSKPEYRRAMQRIEDVVTRHGGRVGHLPAISITPAAVDKIYVKLQEGPRGRRIRQANMSLDIARIVWSVVRRTYPDQFGAENPWVGVRRIIETTTKPAATRAEAYALAYALRDIGEPHLGAAALICFEWHQRPEHVRAGDITWQDYRPAERTDAVLVRHPKTGVKGWVPLEDDGGLLFPDLEAFLAELPRLGVPIVLTQGRRGPPRPYSAEYAQRKVREARAKASLGEHVTLDACRHGGLTELGDAGVTEFEGMAASMHKTPGALRLYVKRSEAQRLNAARKRRAHVASGG
jgi:integrase